MKLRIRSSIAILICAGTLLAAPIPFKKAKPRTQAQAQVLDHAQFLCSNCFFAPSDYYFCFDTGNQIFVAYQRIPVINWRDKTKNDLTRVPRVRDKLALWNPPTQSFPISYDEKNIWVSRDNGKQVKLIRSGLSDRFASDARCRPTPKAPWARP
jgi:hypothetical protein